jgi:hypothetical protein
MLIFAAVHLVREAFAGNGEGHGEGLGLGTRGWGLVGKNCPRPLATYGADSSNSPQANGPWAPVELETVVTTVKRSSATKVGR